MEARAFQIFITKDNPYAPCALTNEKKQDISILELNNIGIKFILQWECFHSSHPSNHFIYHLVSENVENFVVICFKNLLRGIFQNYVMVHGWVGV